MIHIFRFETADCALFRRIVCTHYSSISMLGLWQYGMRRWMQYEHVMHCEMAWPQCDCIRIFCKDVDFGFRIVHCRHTPFIEAWNEDEATIHKRIIEGTLAWPEDACPHLSDKFMDFVTDLLHPEPQNRLGANGWSEVKNHDWLRGFDWVSFLRGKMSAPIVPRVPNNDPTFYFKDFDQIPHEEFHGDDSWCKKVHEQCSKKWQKTLRSIRECAEHLPLPVAQASSFETDVVEIVQRAQKQVLNVGSWNRSPMYEEVVNLQPKENNVLTSRGGKCVSWWTERFWLKSRVLLRL